MPPRPFDRAARLAVMTLILLFTAFMHFHLLSDYPPGLDSDATQDGLEALKLLRHNIWPFYNVGASNPDPIYIFTAAATSALFGVHTFSLRFATVIYGLWGVAATYTCLSELGRGSFDARTRFLIASLASAALAVSQLLSFMDRMGLRFITQIPLQMLAVWALSRAVRTSRRPMWIAAGLLAGLTQYTYPSARLLPLLFFLVLLFKFFQEKPALRTFAAGVGLYAGAALLVLLPQIVWYAQYPHTFLARAGQTSFTQNPLYAEHGLGGVLGSKFGYYRLILDGYWDGQYDQIKEPIFTPFFYYGFLLGLAACLLHVRKWFVPIVLSGLAIMVLPDLISGDREWPHELRLVGAYPFLAALSGLGLASLWALLKRWPLLQRALLAAMALAVVYTAAAEAEEFFSMDKNFGRMYWGGNTWLRRVDNGVGQLIADDSRAYLLPLEEYADPPVKYFTSRRALTIHSALDAGGSLVPPLTDGNRPVRLLLPRGDNDELWVGDATQWVLIDGERAYVLPPLAAADLELLFPPQDESTAIYGRGSNTIIRIGHSADITLGQLNLAGHYAPDAAHEICFDAGMCLVGTGYDSRALSPGGTLTVQLHWQARRPARDDYLMFVHLLDRDGNAVSGIDAYPLFQAFRTYEWKPGETVISQTRLSVPPGLPPGPYAIEVGFYLPHIGGRLKTVAPDGTITGDRVYLAELKVPRPAPPPPDDPLPTPITFGDELALLGYRIDSLPGDAQPLRVTLWWRGLRTASQNWTGFFHLTPAADSLSILGQADRSLTGGAYPPTVWDAGELVEEQIEVAADGLTPGRYALWMGLYSPAAFERLAITDSPNPVEDNRTLLLEFEITP